MNKWTWKHVYEAENKMKELATAYAERKDDPEFSDIVKQAGRELFFTSVLGLAVFDLDQGRGGLRRGKGFAPLRRLQKTRGIGG